MHFCLLADRPEALPQVAGWYFDEWGHAAAQASVATIAAKLALSLNRDRLPLMLLALRSDTLVAAVELKFREMDSFPQYEHWLGGLYVLPAYRGDGLAAQLVEKAVEYARRCGVQTLYLQTEKLDGGLYARLGWQPLQQVCNRGIEVLVMARSLDASLGLVS